MKEKGKAAQDKVKINPEDIKETVEYFVGNKARGRQNGPRVFLLRLL